MALPLLAAMAGRVALPIIGRLLGGSAASSILGGLGRMGGLSKLLGIAGKFLPMAGKILGKLGNLGLGGLPRPPAFGRIPFSPFRPPVGRPIVAGGPPSGPTPSHGGGALGQAQGKFDSAMKQLTSGKKLDQQTMIKLQQQIQEANRMFEMINNIQKAIHDSLKSMIRNIQA